MFELLEYPSQKITLSKKSLSSCLPELDVFDVCLAAETAVVEVGGGLEVTHPQDLLLLVPPSLLLHYLALQGAQLLQFAVAFGAVRAAHPRRLQLVVLFQQPSLFCIDIGQVEILKIFRNPF